MATTVVTLLNGSYSYEDGNIKVSGGLNINANKVIQSVDGPVFENNVRIGSFSAKRDMPESQGGLQYNISFTDITKAGTLVTAAQAAVSAVQAELTPVDE